MILGWSDVRFHGAASQNVRREFVTGVLSEEELGNKIFVYELQGEYTARVTNLRAYDAVSHPIL